MVAFTEEELYSLNEIQRKNKSCLNNKERVLLPQTDFHIQLSVPVSREAPCKFRHTLSVWRPYSATCWILRSRTIFKKPRLKNYQKLQVALFSHGVNFSERFLSTQFPTRHYAHITVQMHVNTCICTAALGKQLFFLQGPSQVISSGDTFYHDSVGSWVKAER